MLLGLAYRNGVAALGHRALSDTGQIAPLLAGDIAGVQPPAFKIGVVAINLPESDSRTERAVCSSLAVLVG
jgi:hypothetical protein